MSPILMAEQPGPDADLKSYSCLTCRQRKVKCDRHNPCSNCVKAARRCSFIPPVRGKRKRTKAPKEGLHAKLRRYEELLKSYGAKIEPSEYDGDSDSETVSQPDVDMAEDADPRSKTGSSFFALKEMKPRLIGDSFLILNSFLIRKMALLSPQMSRTFTSLTSLLVLPSNMVPNTHSKIENLASLHPPYHILLKL